MYISKIINASIPLDQLSCIKSSRTSIEMLCKWGDLGIEIASILETHNGFYAFESSLLFRGIGAWKHGPTGLVEWNNPSDWKDKYSSLHCNDNFLFFSEDIFGNQFAIKGKKIVFMDAETGDIIEEFKNIDHWSEQIIKNVPYYCGQPLAHEWQAKNGPLKPGFRLIPHLPFVCGGKYLATDVSTIGEIDGMLFRANLAYQLKNVPDGEEIIFDIR